MRQMVEVSDVPDGYDLASLMLAEHGPTGAFLIFILVLVWKVGVPAFQAIGTRALALFDQLLEQGKTNNERLAEVKAAIARSDEGNRAAVAALRESVDASTKAITARMDRTETIVRKIELDHVDHEHRIRGLEMQAGGSGVHRRPPTLPPTQ